MVVDCVTSAERIGLAALLEHCQGISPRRLKQTEADVFADHLGDHQRLHHEARDAIRDLRRRSVSARGRTGSLQGEAPHEDRQASEERFLFLVEELVAPVERGLDRSMPRESCTMAASQKSQTILPERRNTLDAESADACGSELDRQRNTIKVPTDLRDARRITVVQFEFIRRGGGPLDKELSSRKIEYL